MREGWMATFWRNLAPAAAIFISLAAAVFSGLQWLATRDQVFLATKPHVDFDIKYDSDEPMVGIAITNAGPGPAGIKAITFYVDRKPVADADDMGRTYAKLPQAELDYQIMEPGDTLAVGEKVWLISYRKPRGGKVNQASKAAFGDFLDKSAAIEIEFCSVIRETECWTKCSDKGRCR
jgi:hypothetical protein